MKTLTKKLKVNKENYYKKHLFLINPILPIQMTNKQIEILATFMSLDGDLANMPFCTQGRKIVREKLNISQGGLGNYLADLKNKKFIYEDENSILRILPLLIPNKKEQTYNFKLEINE